MIEKFDKFCFKTGIEWNNVGMGVGDRKGKISFY